MFIPPEKFRLPSNASSCVPRCNIDVFFSSYDKSLTQAWMISWAGICFISTLFTILTFCMDRTRFKYPERPIVFLAVCYNLYSLAYILRSAAGARAISCDRLHGSSSSSSSAPEEFLIQEGLESTWCIVVFLMLYFFGMAAAIWWVILTLTWFLAAARKWGHEAIQARSSYFHLAGWAAPAVMTIVILTMRRVDGEELTGLCYVGNLDLKAKLIFVIAPLSLVLLFGCCFIFNGFYSLVKIRNDLRRRDDNLDAAVGGSVNPEANREFLAQRVPLHGGASLHHPPPHHPLQSPFQRHANDVAKFERLMFRIGVISVLQGVPAICVLVCYVYEYYGLPHWSQSAQALQCGNLRNYGVYARGGSPLPYPYGEDRSSSSSSRRIPAHYPAHLDPRLPSTPPSTSCAPLEVSIPSTGVFLLRIFMLLVVGTTCGFWIWSQKTWNAWSAFFASFFRSRNRQKTAAAGASSSTAAAASWNYLAGHPAPSHLVAPTYSSALKLDPGTRPKRLLKSHSKAGKPSSSAMMTPMSSLSRAEKSNSPKPESAAHVPTGLLRLGSRQQQQQHSPSPLSPQPPPPPPPNTVYAEAMRVSSPHLPSTNVSNASRSRLASDSNFAALQYGIQQQNLKHSKSRQKGSRSAFPSHHHAQPPGFESLHSTPSPYYHPLKTEEVTTMNL